MNRFFLICAVSLIAACSKDFEPQLSLSTRSAVADGGYLGVVVANDGNDETGEGTYANPYKTIGKALISGDISGNTIYLKAGEYHITERINNRAEPLTIAAYPSEEVTISGTQAISSEWEVHSGNIYVTTLSEELRPYQLFENGEMLNIARWPNVEGFIEDEQPISSTPQLNSLWDQTNTWVALASYTSTEQESLYEQGLIRSARTIPYTNLAGAVAILNIGSFKSSYANIISQSSSTEFTFDTSQVSGFVAIQKPERAFFYLEGKLEMLDKAGEWFFDDMTKKLYLWTKQGGKPQNISGKVQSYAIEVENSSNITLRNLNFRATTVKFTNSPSCSVENCIFSYPSHSKRAIGEGFGEYVDVTTLSSSARFLNTTIQYSEGEALVVKGSNSVIENCLFRHIDYSCVNLQNIGSTVNLCSTENTIFNGNTVYVCGASETILAGKGNIISNNEVYSTAHMQNDGAIVQMMIGDCQNTRIYKNWFHNARRVGVRIDGSKDTAQGDYAGDLHTLASVFNNVLWDCGGLMIKGDYHFVVNNTVFSDKNENTISVVIANRNPTSSNPEYGSNHNTPTFNNLADLIASYSGTNWTNISTIPEEVYNNYVAYYENNSIISDMLMDNDNRDFRPTYYLEIIDKGILIPTTIPEGMDDTYDYYVEHSNNRDDLGAIGYNPAEYDIPGQKLEKSSSPIPANGAMTNAAGLMLSWKTAYRATSTRLYMGTSASDLQQIAELKTTDNCFYPKKDEYPINQRKDVCFWRIDNLVDGEWIEGDIWNFKLY